MARILVTGGDHGIGFETASRLVEHDHDVVLTAPVLSRGEQAAKRLRARSRRARVEVRPLDLSDRKSIRLLGREWSGPLDAVVINAGSTRPSRAREVTLDGIEKTLATNALGPHLLAHELLPYLERSAPSRLVCVTERRHRPGTHRRSLRFDFSDPNLETGYFPDRAWKNSKLALLWFTFELARRLRRFGRIVTANAVCPGFVPRLSAADARGLERLLMRSVYPRLPEATTPDLASRSVTALTLSPALGRSSGRYYEQDRETMPGRDAANASMAARFWDLSNYFLRLSEWPPV
jgi:NAD(P)-dependent dehydrogenase (short-subunit alcohol dehydrogenase family)